MNQMKTPKKNNFSTATRVHSDAYSREEREEIARNIITFIEHAWCETAVDRYGVVEIKRERLTFEQIKWLGVVHDDVLCRIEHA